MRKIISAVAIAMAVVFSISGKTTSGSYSFASPDFAYPQTVERNANLQMQSSLKSGDNVATLQAAIQIVAARNIVSYESRERNVALFDSLSNILPAPYSSLALLLEAKIIENQDSVRLLVEQAMADKVASGVPLSELKTLVSDSQDAVSAGMSVLDFMTYRAVELMRADALQYVESAISRHSEKGLAEAALRSLALSVKGGDDYKSYLKECVERFGDTEYCAEFLRDWNNKMSADDLGVESGNPLRRLKYNMLCDYLKNHPTARNIDVVKSCIATLEQVSVNVQFPSAMVPNSSREEEVTLGNIYDVQLLVYSLPITYITSTSKNLTYRNLSTDGKIVATIPVKVEGSVPDIITTKYELPALPAGVYAIVASRDGKESGIICKSKQNSLSCFKVSEITTISSSAADSNGKGSLYVVSSLTGAPIKDAKVTFTSTKYKETKVESVVTDKDGLAQTSLTHYRYVVEKEGNYARGTNYTSSIEPDNKETKKGYLLTDLSLYRPGDNVGFAAIVYKEQNHQLRMAGGEQVSVVLTDANWQPMDTVALTTDGYGRCNGELIIPSNGLLGRYFVRLLSGDNELNRRSVTVAEYKTPSFFITADSASPSYDKGEDVRVTGRGITYSGMPVSGAKVKYTVTFTPFWRRASEISEYEGETETDVTGAFTLDLASSVENGFGRYDILIDMTDAAGETQQLSVPFSIGEAYHVSASIPSLIDVSNLPKSYMVKVTDAIGNPTIQRVHYRLMSGEKTVKEGSFESPTFSPELGNLKPGAYRSLFSCAADSTADATADFILYNPSDKRPAVESVLWLPVKQIETEPGNDVTIQVGSSYAGSMILAEVSTDEKVIRREWLSRDGVISNFKVKAPAENGRVYVTFVAVHNFEKSVQTVTIIPTFQKESVEVESITFRDRVAPGEQESWKFRFTISGKPCAEIPVFAVMTDASLNAIVPFSWSLNPYSSLFWMKRGGFSVGSVYSYSTSAVLSPTTSGKYVSFSEPDWNLYSQTLYGGALRIRGGGNRMLMSSKSMALASAEGESDGVMYGAVAECEDLAVAMDMDNSVDAGAAEVSSPTTPTIQFREKECPRAFFMPELVTDQTGCVEIPFTAPDFIGTWQFQIAGYNTDMKGGVKSFDVIAAKEVMAQMNAPRFLRTGDKVTLAATLYNNSEAEMPVSGMFEVYDASGNAVAVEKFEAENVAASGSRVVTASFTAPVTTALIVTCYANGGKSTDGERVAIPVLPSSTPVTESTTFYMAPDAVEKSVQLPTFDNDARVTLQYCSNPVWECVTALPGIENVTSKSALTNVRALYAVSLANGLFRKYPKLVDGIKQMAENPGDSTLVSSLQKNSELKVVALNNTPWINSASAETERMQSLTEYAEPGNGEAAISSLIQQLASLRNEDGGWSWCPDMPSSEFITERVLARLGDLQRLGFMPKEAESWIKSGYAYCDKELVKEWEKSKREYFSEIGLLDYLYSKCSFSGVGNTSTFAVLESQALKKIESNWRNYDIYHKATAALLLYSKGKKSKAMAILESLRQYASSDADKGVWYDNLGSQWNGADKLLTTARVLRAFAKLQPENPIIDGLRQWLVLSKQTEDWTGESALAEVTSAILDSGEDWTQESSLPIVTLNGKVIEPDHSAVLTGAFTVTLSSEDASGAVLHISKTGEAPSWGGVISQYVAPIAEVKSESVPQLSISKAVYAVTTDGIAKGASEDFRVGDRVRVVFTIKSDRDMDYVAVMDSRAACLEPETQVSSYRYSDGIYYYQEVRDDSTNLFISFLPKGKSVLSYDCYVDREGEYSLGIVTAQSQYAPTIVAHSAGAVCKITK